MTTQIQRDCYGAIDLAILPQRTRRMVENLVNAAASAKHVDEHGTWEFGCDWGEFDRKAMDYDYQSCRDVYRPAGWACNWDLYGHARDAHSRYFLALIQVRQSVREHRGWHMRVRKNYFLVGRNEDGSTFAHPVGAHAIHAAIRAGRCPVMAAQNWIFGADYRRVIRQGDMGLLPKKPSGNGRFVAGGPMRIDVEGSHVLNADRFFVTREKIFAFNPRMKHLRGVHPVIDGLGWHLLLIGQRTACWDFAKPTID